MAFVLPAIAAMASSATAAAGTAAAASIPSWVGYASVGASLASGAVGAYGSIMQGQAAADAANYNAEVAKQNANIATQKAGIAGQTGEAQAAMQEQKTRATVGAIKAGQAASGLEVDTGSAVDVRSSAAELGQLDALTVRTNAAKEAYGYTTQATSDMAQSQLDKYEAATAGTAGAIGAGSSLLGGVGSAATNWAKFQMQGAFG